MKNYCIFCGKPLVEGMCACSEYINYYGASATYAAPVEPVAAPVMPVAPTEAAPATPAEPASKDPFFSPAGDL